MNILQPIEQLPVPQGSTFAIPVSCFRLLFDETGQDLIEYALLAALISLCAVTTMRTLGTRIGAAFDDIATTFTSAI